jgi:hypothetical protein
MYVYMYPCIVNLRRNGELCVRLVEHGVGRITAGHEAPVGGLVSREDVQEHGEVAGPDDGIDQLARARGSM